MNLTSRLLAGFFDWMLSVSIMATVTVVFIMLIQRILHKRIKPRWHYLMWMLVLVRLLLPWHLESNFSIYNWISYPNSIHEIDSAAVIAMQEEFAGSGATENLLHKYAMYVWLLGIVLFASYTFVINRKFTLKITKETRPITDIGIIQLFSRCQQLMSIHKPVTLVSSDKITMPTLFGFRSPKLIIPQTAINSLSQEQLQHVFLHELAHCKRNDIGVNWLMQVLLIIHWFNPVLWYAYQRMREDQEIASDALALSYLEPAKRENYGYTLIQLLEIHARPVSVPSNVHLSGNKSQLKRRIMMIKQFQFNSYRWSFLGLAAVLIVSGCSLTNASVDKKSATETNTAIVDQKTTDTSKVTTGTDTNSVSQSSSETKSADVVATSTPSATRTVEPSSKPAPSAAASEPASARAQAAQAAGESKPARAVQTPQVSARAQAAQAEGESRLVPVPQGTVESTTEPRVARPAAAPASVPTVRAVATPAPVSVPAPPQAVSK